MDADEGSDLRFLSIKADVAVTTSFVTSPTPSSLVGLACRKGLEYRKADGHINGGDESTACGGNLVSFRPPTPEFTRLECVHGASISARVFFTTIRQGAPLLGRARSRLFHAFLFTHAAGSRCRW